MMTPETVLSCGAILAAGGSGSRMAADRPKQLLPLNGVPILVRSCEVLLQVPGIAEIVVVAPGDWLADCEAVCRNLLPPARLPCLHFTAGGASRQDSVRAGLMALSPALPLVLVHDAARPLADAELAQNCLACADRFGAAIAALPLVDTIKAVQDGRIVATLDRSRLWQAQTPQAARRELLIQAYALAEKDGFQATDEAALLEHAGIAVHTVAGSRRNLKITRPEDLLLARVLLNAGDQARGTGMRIGHGFDVHRLVAGRKLILGGVTIDHPLGLLGHSDADVVCHALMDALLGALALGDIGRHFPDSDARYRDADSLKLLATVWQMAVSRGMRLANADVSIICQKPKLAPHLGRMQANLAQACHAESTRFNVKASTTEQLGYTGRGEGIAAHAVVLLEENHGA